MCGVAGFKITPKPRGVIGRPVAERSWRRSRDLRERGCHQRRLIDCRRPGVEQHIHDERRHVGEPLGSRVFRRHLFNTQRAADHFAHCRYLLELAQGLRPGQNILRSGVSALTQGANRNRGDVTLIDRSCSSGEMGPAYDIAGASLRRPPQQGI